MSRNSEYISYFDYVLMNLGRWIVNGLLDKIVKVQAYFETDANDLAIMDRVLATNESGK